MYLSRNGVVIESNSTILITDIGTSSPQHLVCTTDKSDCCRGITGMTFNGVADWLFPDGRIVPRVSVAQTFGRDRSSNGETNLYRANNDVMSPTGRFCCRVPDATGTNHTLCVVISECIDGNYLYCKLTILIFTFIPPPIKHLITMYTSLFILHSQCHHNNHWFSHHW